MVKIINIVSIQILSFIHDLLGCVTLSTPSLFLKSRVIYYTINLDIVEVDLDAYFAYFRNL